MNKMENFINHINLWKNWRDKFSAHLVLVLLLTTIYLFWTFPLDFIAGTSPYWSNQRNDIGQFVSGFNAYFAEEWHFPILNIDSINYPVGTNAVMLDTIPLLACLLKLVVPNSFFPFVPYGGWIAFCLFMQTIVGLFILRALKISCWYTTVALTISLLVFPPWTEKIHHCVSLFSHWTILIGFLFYLQSHQRPYQMARWTVLIVSTFYIHLYLVVMVIGIFFVTTIKNWQRLTFLEKIKQLLIPLTSLVISWFLTFLPIPGGNYNREWGFGHYSMNLLSPLNGGSFLELINAQMPGQYEGFNYLGIVMIALAIYAFHLRNTKDPSWRFRHRVLLGLMFIFTLYALSDQIYLGSLHLFSIHYPEFLTGITGQLRSSGRFFWPVGYLLTIYTIITIRRYAPPYLALAILIILLPLHLADVWRYQTDLGVWVKTFPANLVDFPTWSRSIGTVKDKDVDKIFYYPKMRCERKTNIYDNLVPVMMFASAHQITLNTGYVTRLVANCNAIASEIKNSPFYQSVYLFDRIEFPSLDFIELLFPPSVAINCQPLDFTYLCQQENGHQKLGPTTKTIRINSTYFFTGAGKFDNNGIRTIGNSGFLLYGPYQRLPAGKYQVKVFGDINTFGTEEIWFDVTSGAGLTVYQKLPLQLPKVSGGPLASVDFTLDQEISDIEFRVRVLPQHDLNIHRIVLTRWE